MQQKLLTIRELAAHLKIAPRTVFRLVDEGKIPPGIKIGHSIRWPDTLITEWITGGAKPTDISANTTGRS